MKATLFTREDVYRLLSEHNLTQQWLADRLGISLQCLNRRLIVSKDFSTSFQEQLNEVFKREGIITENNEQINYLIKITLQTDSTISDELSQLNTLVEKITRDNDLTFDERKKAIEFLENMKIQVEEKIYQLIRILKGTI